LEVINPPPPSLDFGAMAMTKSLEGTSRFFCIRIIDASLIGKQIVFKGKIKWQDANSQVVRDFVTFENNPFAARDFCNDEIGTEPTNKQMDIVQEVIDDLMAKGKPSGTLFIRLELFHANNLGVPIDVQEKSIVFANPSQTLEIIAPLTGSQQDIGNVLLQWNPVPAAIEYLIKANVRTRTSQSLEEAINQGNPLINNKSVGSVTSVNMRDLLDREWKAGEEVVVQVTAVIPGIGGGQKFYSNIINFYITDPNSRDLSVISNTLTNLFAQFPGSIDPEFVNQLLTGKIRLNEIIGSDGSKMTIEDLVALLNYFAQNPDAVLNVNLQGE
jgi:hypothetical protein